MAKQVAVACGIDVSNKKGDSVKDKGINPKYSVKLR
jgi:hypothetical protein